MQIHQIPIDETTRRQVIQHLSGKLRQNYIFPDVAEEICRQLQYSLDAGEFAEYSDGNLFALALTLNLQEVNHDEHLWVRWHPETLPEHEGQLRLNPAWQALKLEEARQENFGFSRVEILPGGVGLLDIRYLHRPAWVGDTLVSALNFISHARALLIDLRHCTGGYPGMVALLCTYLFGYEPVHLASIYWRDEDVTQQYWTLPYVPGQRFLDKPVYVLTSPDTFSAGAMLAWVIQVRKRGLVIGEKTSGGANPGDSLRLHPHFEAFIPIGRCIDLLTGGNWEGIGILPDVQVPLDRVFPHAYRIALESLLTLFDSVDSQPECSFHHQVSEALLGLINTEPFDTVESQI